MEAPGLLFGRYKPLRRLGRGGMGTVTLVEDTGAGGQERALKEVDLPPGGGDVFDLLKSEFEILARYEHPYLAKAYDLGREGSRAYFTMEVVSGCTLLDACARLDLSGMLRLLIQTLEALSFVHSLGLVHGDVKPGNILVDTCGDFPSVRLLDFGLAESILESTGVQTASSGTPAYFPPEKVQGAPPDPRSDLYSLGVTLFHVITGQLPFRADSPGRMIELHRSTPPPPPSSIDPSLPKALDPIVARLLEKEFSSRYPSADAVISELVPLVPGLQPPEKSRGGRHLLLAGFVGRDGALRSLTHSLHPSLFDGAGPRALTLMGPGGAGKSRLAREYALSARVSGCRVLESSFTAAGRTGIEPLSDIVRSLASVLPSLDPKNASLLGTLQEDPRSSAESSASELVLGLDELFQAASDPDPLLIVLEDIHLAEPLPLKILMEIVSGKTRGAWAVLFTSRDQFENPRSRGILSRVEQDGSLSVVRPEPLTPQDVAAWVSTSLPGACLPADTARAVSAWSGGNPFLVREALLSGLETGRFDHRKTGWQYVPPPEGKTFPRAGMETERRYRTLSPREQEILSTLALHPGLTSLSLLSEVLDEPDAAALFPILRNLSRKGWVQENKPDRSFGLSHERLRRPVRRNLEPSVREQKHRRFAELLSPKAETDPALVPLVAEHWLRSGEQPQGAVWAKEACKLLLRARSRRKAMRFGRASRRAAVAADLDLEALSRIEIVLGWCYSHLGRILQAEHIFREITTRDLSPVVLEMAYRNLGYSIRNQGRPEEALAAFNTALDLLGEDAPLASRVDLVDYAIFSLFELGRFEEILKKGKDQLPLYRDDIARACGLFTLCRAAASVGRLDEAEAYAVEAMACERRTELWNARRIGSFQFMGILRLQQGKLRSAVRWFKSCMRLSPCVEDRHGYASAGILLTILAEMGDPEAALEHTHEARDIFFELEERQNRIQGEKALADLFLDLGDYGLVRKKLLWLEETSRCRSADSPQVIALVSLTRADYWRRAGRPQEALEVLDRIREVESKVDLLTGTSLRLCRGACLLEAGHPASAWEAVEAVVPDRTPPYRHTPAHIERGRILTALGRYPEAEEEFRSARRTALDQGMAGRIPEVLFHHGESAFLRGKWAEAQSLAGQSLRGAQKNGREALLWRVLSLAGRIEEALGNRRASARFFRRALWAAEREASAFPQPDRSSFLGRKDASDLFRRQGMLRSEDTAARLTSHLIRLIPPSLETPEETAAAWIQTCRTALGADASVIYGAGTSPLAAWGDPPSRGESWELDLPLPDGKKGRIVLFRAQHKGRFLPAARRWGPRLADRLSVLLAQGQACAIQQRFDRMERMYTDQIMEAETALRTARSTLSQTQTQLGEAKGYGEMIGTSPAMREVYSLIRRVGPTDVHVIITGESGTGKELAARALHAASTRREGPFFAVNCAAVTESLLSEELFGHEKGAFTGADDSRPGIFELAQGGSLVLDEVADMSPGMQGRLLRVLEEKAVRRIGSGFPIKVDVRILALTNRPLDKEVNAGRFRADLFHRLNVAALTLPTLRQRKEDIHALAEYFLAEFQAPGKRARLSRATMAALMRYRWPGNVRQLRNELQRAALLAHTRSLTPDDFSHLAPAGVTDSSLSEGLLAKLREATAQAGMQLELRHQDLFRVLSPGGTIRREEYETLANISRRTANRDLAAFVSMGLLKKLGKGKATSYGLR